VRPARAGTGRAGAVLLGIVLALAAGSLQAQPDSMRDFPPLRGPGMPDSVRYIPVPTPPPVPVPTPEAETPGIPSAPRVEEEGYLLGVGDELEVSVLGQPALSRMVKVRPDGNISSPGVGTIFVLGRSPEEVGQEIEQALAKYLRYPQVELLVSNYGTHRVFVMGEVFVPGDHEYIKGMTALQAVATAGGIRSSGKSGKVVILRRTGAGTLDFFQRDLGDIMKGKRGAEEDVVLKPYDIVYVPRSFVADVGIFIDQYIRPLIIPFSLYIYGWDAFHAEEVRPR